jgi:hypothetical protein
MQQIEKMQNWPLHRLMQHAEITCKAPLYNNR